MNLLTTPIVMLWPELWPQPNLPLWCIEIIFLMDVLRKCVIKKQGSFAEDSYDIFVEYFGSNFLIDIIPLVPNLFSGLDLKYTPLKIVRVYEIGLLHFFLGHLARAACVKKTESEKKDIIYSFSTLSKIIVLLHYLSCFWLYIGSEAFLGYDDGYVPWQLRNEDFKDFSRYQLYVFSTYWVCTVVTTVGYGDYNAETTLEYEVTLFLEFFGLVVFAVLQMTVTRMAADKYGYKNYIYEKEQQIDMWLLTIEKSNPPYHLPGEML